MIIDFHTHCYPDALAKKAFTGLPPHLDLGPYYDGTITGLKALMQETGVGISVILHIASRPDSTRHVNDWAIRTNQEEGILSFGSIHPMFPDYKAEIRRLKENGIMGIKFHPHYQHVLADDRCAYPLYEAIANEEMMMLFHLGKDAKIAYDYSSPRLFHNVMHDFKGAKLIAAHLGGWTFWEDCVKYILGQDLYIDTAYSMPFLSDAQRKIVFERHDPNRILFGTDTPWAHPFREIRLMQDLIKDSKIYQKIMCGNAARLLGLDKHMLCQAQ